VKTWLVTGGAGFIGSNFVLTQRYREKARIINLDKLTYAGNLMNLESLHNDRGHIFVQGDINDRSLLRTIFLDYRPDAVIHCAAESHVDRSIYQPDTFIQTNIVGTFVLLEEVLHYWETLIGDSKKMFRFLHISTDEVYGSLGPDDPPFTESTPYTPNSPYAASKAASDQLVRSFFKTYSLPALVSNCSNNYGPYQFPEKLIPLMILNALSGKPMPIYGDGKHIRDWIYVQDHVEAIILILEHGAIGETYNIGGSCERTNEEVVRTLCKILDEQCPDSHHTPHESLITYIKDRPGHDRRYAMDFTKLSTELGWKPTETLESGLRKTVRWHKENPQWVESVQSGAYQEWIHVNYYNR